MIIVLGYITAANAEVNTIPITYTSYVDDNYGFFKVLDVTTHKPSPYENRVLTINQGDVVIWINDVDNNVPLTIVSEQDLWPEGNGNLRSSRQKFSYKFDQPGRYTFYIQQYSSRRQTIIVNAVTNDQIPIPVTTDTPIPTETYTPSKTTKITYTPISTVIPTYTPVTIPEKNFKIGPGILSILIDLYINGSKSSVITPNTFSRVDAITAHWGSASSGASTTGTPMYSKSSLAMAMLSELGR